MACHFNSSEVVSCLAAAPVCCWLVAGGHRLLCHSLVEVVRSVQEPPVLTYYASPNVNPALRCGALCKGLFVPFGPAALMVTCCCTAYAACRAMSWSLGLPTQMKCATCT
jgi:hypothetical protein